MLSRSGPVSLVECSPGTATDGVRASWKTVLELDACVARPPVRPAASVTDATVAKMSVLLNQMVRTYLDLSMMVGLDQRCWGDK